jgi:N-acylglucosamine 2-epimerase
MKNIGQFYKEYLLDIVAPFWLKNGVDKEYGGFLTCVEQNGDLFSEDKSVWFQGRGTWIFAKLYNTVKADPEYLSAAKSGYEFLKKCYDKDGRMFFIVTRDAKPIQKRRYYFSETFAAIACAEYYTASGDNAALELSRKTFDIIEKLYRNTSMTVHKYYIENLNIKSLAVPMILLSTAQVLRSHDKERELFYDNFITEMLNEILTGGYLNEDKKALFEFTSIDNTSIKGPKGRLVNPGHSIEAAWFIAIEALRRDNNSMLKKAFDIIDWSLELGWDKQFGGLFSFVDVEGRPAEQLEWDMKLWWPHTEALYALALAWKITKDEKYKEWFDKFNDYSFSKFNDPTFGEWFGYLHRDGSVSNTLKGNIFKGPYHLPRALILISDLLKQNDLENYFPL